jgi:hypothetical protein
MRTARCITGTVLWTNTSLIFEKTGPACYIREPHLYAVDNQEVKSHVAILVDLNVVAAMSVQNTFAMTVLVDSGATTVITQTVLG